MKKLVFLLLILFVVCTAIVSADVSKMFVKSMPITKIYTHRLGFKVVYLKTDLSLGSFYVPLRWFDEAGGKGILLKGNDAAYPFFTVFWLDGEFHSIKIYAKSSYSDDTWGSLRHDASLAEKFDIEAIFNTEEEIKGAF